MANHLKNQSGYFRLFCKNRYRIGFIFNYDAEPILDWSSGIFLGTGDNSSDHLCSGVLK